MTETYDEKKKRIRRQAQSLPYDLGNRVSIRSTKAISNLHLGAQSVLSAALDLGLPSRKVKTAVNILTDEPDISAVDLLRSLEIEPAISVPMLKAIIQKGASDKRTQNLMMSLGISTPEPDTVLLAGLTQACFPDMAESAAEAYAETDMMSKMAALVESGDAIIQDRNMTDISIILLAGFIRQMTTRVNKLLEENPTFRNTLQNSAVNWIHEQN